VLLARSEYKERKLSSVVKHEKSEQAEEVSKTKIAQDLYENWKKSREEKKPHSDPNKEVEMK
jgi:hypothetical protein